VSFPRYPNYKDSGVEWLGEVPITAFLDRETAKIDELVAEQRRLMELLKEKRQAVISHAVTRGLNPNAPLKPSGIEWLGDVPEHWRDLQLHHPHPTPRRTNRHRGAPGAGAGQVRHPDRRSPARHRPAARTPDRADLRRRHRADRCAPRFACCLKHTYTHE
jgi:hypothetical protein